MIELNRHPVKILHLNVRTEKHGEDEVNALDIKIGFSVPNASLEYLADGLRRAMYEADDDPNMAVPGTDEDHLTHVRFPQFGKQKWAGEWDDVGLTFHLGNGRGKGDLLFANATFGQLSVDPQEGGLVACVARAQVLPSPDEITKLVGLLKHEIPATLDWSNAVDGDADEEED